jgi:hypothetical protein
MPRFPRTVANARDFSLVNDDTACLLSRRHLIFVGKHTQSRTTDTGDDCVCEMDHFCPWVGRSAAEVKQLACNRTLDVMEFSGLDARTVDSGGGGR